MGCHAGTWPNQLQKLSSRNCLFKMSNRAETMLSRQKVGSNERVQNYVNTKRIIFCCSV